MSGTAHSQSQQCSEPLTDDLSNVQNRAQIISAMFRTAHSQSQQCPELRKVNLSDVKDSAESIKDVSISAERAEPEQCSTRDLIIH